MDPNECLKELLALSKRIAAFADATSDLKELHDDDLDLFLARVSDLCNHVDGIDEWLKRGGFLPERWEPKSEEIKVVDDTHVSLRGNTTVISPVGLLTVILNGQPLKGSEFIISVRSRVGGL